MNLNAPNLNVLWADLLVEEFHRAGVRLACISPGSRNTPLLTALARHGGIRTVAHYDERGAAFCALGYGRATGRPALWVTTSGTALANGYPAMVEASQGGVPLVALTADRPPELRDTGANQTIDQVKFFGRYARWSHDLPCPTEAIGPEMVLLRADQAYQAAVQNEPGPVHLNCMFREPLAPSRSDGDLTEYLTPLRRWMTSTQPWKSTSAGSIPTAESMDDWAVLLNGAKRGVLVAGSLAPADTEAVTALAGQLGWPVLADITSGLSRRRAGPVVPWYDLMLASESFRGSVQPDVVLHLGGPLVSKRLSMWLADARPVYLQVSRQPFGHDPHLAVTHFLSADIEPVATALQTRAGTSADPDWLQRWLTVSEAVGAVVEQELQRTEHLTEPLVARTLSRIAPQGHALVGASSMPVRDLNTFAADRPDVLPVMANRGASGIDGTVASAAGYALGAGSGVTVLLGDLALLHDLNSLPLLHQAGTPAVLVVVNNHGGGIFHFLPVHEHASLLDPYIGGTHDVTFEEAAALYGLSYQSVATPDELVSAYEAAWVGTTPALIEVPSDRDTNLAVHRALEQAAVTAVERHKG